MYYSRRISIKHRIKYTLRMLIKSLKDTKGMAERKYKSAMFLKGRYDLAGKSILEVGAGDRGGLCSILGLDNRTVALDLPERSISLNIYLKSVVRKCFFDPIYQYYLKRLVKKSLHKVKVVYSDACTTNLAVKSFDFIISEWVLEHIHKEDIDSFAKENKRLLRYGGVADHKIGLWTSLGGGHTFGWSNPWKHLSDKNFKTTVYLNKLKKAEYEAVFKQCFGKDNVVVEITRSSSASELLTDEVLSKLSLLGYSKEDLIINSMRLIAYKK